MLMVLFWGMRKRRCFLVKPGLKPFKRVHHAGGLPFTEDIKASKKYIQFIH